MNDVGLLKVHATAEAVRRLDPTVEIVQFDARYRAKQEVGQAVFCYVDSIETRAAIWRSAGRRAEFWADGRMLGEIIRVLIAADEPSRKHYPSTLFAGSEAQPWPLHRPQHDLFGEYSGRANGASVRTLASSSAN